MVLPGFAPDNAVQVSPASAVVDDADDEAAEATEQTGVRSWLPSTYPCSHHFVTRLAVAS